MSPVTGESRLSRYRIERLLGKGAHAEVHLATDLQLERPVALKLIDLSSARTPDREEVRARFEREAKLTARLSHPNIVVVHEFGEADGRLFLAMEFVPGGTLANRLLAGAPPLPIAERIVLAVEIADAVAHAHDKGILHRDLKPANILLTESGHAKVSDFGIGRLLEGDVELTAAGEIVGSPAYMSPEQTRGERVDARSDIFGLGLVLYHLFTGKKAFDARNLPALIGQIQNHTPVAPTTLDPAIPAGADDIVFGCLAKDKHARYHDAHAVADDLRALLLPVFSEVAQDGSSKKLRRMVSDSSAMRRPAPAPQAKSTDELPRVERRPQPPPLPAVPAVPAPLTAERKPLPVRAIAIGAGALAVLLGLALVVSRGGGEKTAATSAPAPAADPAAAAAPTAAPTPTPLPPAAPADAAGTADAFLSEMHETWPAPSPASAHVTARRGLRLQIVPGSARVFLDGKYVGVADDWSGDHPGAVLSFPHAWKHELRVAHPGNGDLTIELVVTPGARQDVATVNETLPAGTSSAPEALAGPVPPAALATSGALRLAVVPGTARVRLDGVEVGSASDFERRDLTLTGPSVHTITLSLDGKPDVDVRVLVSATVPTSRATLRRKL